jgi:hypothetical protein
MARKPTGGKPFDDLMRKLIQVPKKELDREEKRYAKKKAKRKRK